MTKNYMTAKQIENTINLKSGTLRQIVNRNTELQKFPYSEKLLLNGKKTRVYYKPIENWLNKYYKKNNPLQSNSYNVTPKLPTGAQLNALIKIYSAEELKARLDYIMNWCINKGTYQRKTIISTSYTKKQSLIRAINYHASNTGNSYSLILDSLFNDYFGVKEYYDLNQTEVDIFDYIESINQFDDFATFTLRRIEGGQA